MMEQKKHEERFAALKGIESLPRIKLTLEAMSTWEDWEMVCQMAGAKPEYTASVTLYVAKADIVKDGPRRRTGFAALVKTHNSSVSAKELKEELEIRGIPSKYADTGLWVRPEDLDYAESVLAELEAGNEEEQ